MYEAHSKREQVEKANRERNAYISGLLANTNLDDNKGSKRNALESIDNSYYETLKSIYNIEIEEVNLRKDPFFAAMKIPGIDIPVVDEDDNIVTPVPDRTTTIENYDVDQE